MEYPGVSESRGKGKTSGGVYSGSKKVMMNKKFNFNIILLILIRPNCRQMRHLPDKQFHKFS